MQGTNCEIIIYIYMGNRSVSSDTGTSVDEFMMRTNKLSFNAFYTFPPGFYVKLCHVVTVILDIQFTEKNNQSLYYPLINHYVQSGFN